MEQTTGLGPVHTYKRKLLLNITIAGKVFLAGAAALLAVILFCNATVFWIGSHGIFADSLAIPPNQTAVLLGAGMKKDGTMSLQQADRTAAALDLYKRGKVAAIYVTGEAGQKKYDEVNPMKNFMLANGVQETAVIVDAAGFDTYDSLYRARHVFGIDRAIIVTHYYHLPRALFIARSLGMQADGLAADRRRYPRWLYVNMRETLARVKAVLNVIFDSRPEVISAVRRIAAIIISGAKGQD